MIEEPPGPEPSRLELLYGVLEGPEKGKRLEEFCAEIFEYVDGVEVYKRNVVDDAKSQELDIVLWNDENNGLSVLGPYFFVEAKNWSEPVGSAEVAWFDWKLRLGGCTSGLLVSAKGITGRAEDAKSAWMIVYEARRDGRSLIIVSPEELFTSVTSGSFVELIRRKVMGIATRSSDF